MIVVMYLHYRCMQAIVEQYSVYVWSQRGSGWPQQLVIVL